MPSESRTPHTDATVAILAAQGHPQPEQAAGGSEFFTSTAALDSLYRVRELQDATAGLRRFLTQLDEDTRAAAIDAAAADVSERAIAARLGVAQPTVHAWLDERRAAPLPPPSLVAEVRSLHTIATALQGLVMRLEGRELAERAPSSRHVTPATAARSAREALATVTNDLGRLAAALDYEAQKAAESGQQGTGPV
jgi:hypothetical protein